jgi:hypothetical protein
MSPQDYCTARIAGQPGYYAALFAPAKSRLALQAMVTIHAELAAIPTRCSDPAVAQAKYQWWLTDITRAQTGEPQHPALRALKASPTGRHVQADHLARLLEALATPLGTDGLAPRPGATHDGQTPGAIFGRLLALAGEEQRPGPLQAAEDMGEQLRGSDLTLRGRTASSDAFGPARTEAARVTLGHALQGGYGLKAPALRPHLVLGELRLAQLRRLDADAEAPAPSAALHPLTMLWIAWRTARRAA